MKPVIAIFTRYPESGKAKTRLIEALGVEGAADLHRQMAEHTLAQAKMLQSIAPVVQLEVWFTGGTLAAMQSWLGDGVCYQEQVGGDLGDRLIHAAQSAFEDGATSVIIIGTDCPELDSALLQQAIDQLHHCDLVLGPAVDGGYYLIGLRYCFPQLFRQIAWSTADVLHQTVAIAEQLGLAIVDLPVLSDVDYPEDLVVWERVRSEGK